MGFGNKQSVIIEEMEYIGELSSTSTSFSVPTQYPINPGQSSSFPWLSTIAKNYEKYEFLALQWIYKPEVSQYATNGQTGKILMSVDYDASDAPPQNKQQMEDVVPHSDAMPYQQLKLNCRPKEMHQNSDAKFVRPGNLPANNDIKTYDAGNMFIATSGIATNTGVLGEIHVRYIVKLSIPILEGTTSSSSNNSLTEFTDTTPLSLTTTVDSIDTFLNLVGTNGINVVNTAGVLTVPTGNYLVIWTAQYVNSGAYTTLVVSKLKLNGTQVSIGASTEAGAVDSLVSGTYFWRSDGTSATGLTLVNNATFVGGTQTVVGTIVINSM
jgi:hypothetical protein